MSKIVYRRYAGLFFCACVDTNDNELAYLEAIHFFVEVLDAFFGNVCELDLVFNFYKVRGRCVLRRWRACENWHAKIGR
jgi:AP-2 complex subunit sigma-1